MVTVVKNYSHSCACRVHTSHSYYSRAAFVSLRASDCAATVRGRRPFEGGGYSTAASVFTVNGNTTIGSL